MEETKEPAYGHQKWKVSGPMDDEVTNTDTAYNQDIFGTRSAVKDEAPSFGSLVCDATRSQDAVRKQSHHMSELSPLAKLAEKNKASSSNPKTEAAPKSIKEKYENSKFSNAPAFASFGKQDLFLRGDNKSKSQQPNKPKKQSICDDDELLFAVAQNNPK